MYNFPEPNAAMAHHATRCLQVLRTETPPDDISLYLIGEPRNNPDPIHGNYDVALARALSDNSTVETIRLLVAPATLTHLDQWSSLLRTIQSGRAGKGIKYLGIDVYHVKRPDLLSPIQQRQVGDIVSTLLHEFEGLSSLEALGLNVPCIPAAAVASLLDAAPPIFQGLSWSKFDVDSCDGIQQVAAAVDRRNKIRKLFLAVPCSFATERLLDDFAKAKVKLGQEGNAPLTFFMDHFTDVPLEMVRRISRFKLTRVNFVGVRSEALFNAIMGVLQAPSPTWLYLDISVEGANEWMASALLAAPRTCLDALKSNSKLLRVEVDISQNNNKDAPFFNSDAERDEHRLYIDRNRRLRDWIDNPSTVPKNLWFQALRLAMLAGHDEFYQGLQILSSEVRPRKRKDRSNDRRECAKRTRVSSHPRANP